MIARASDQFEQYKVWPIRLRLVRGVDLFSLLGSNAKGAGEDVLLARDHRILVSVTPRGLHDFVVSGKGHSMTKWSNFQSLRKEAKSGGLSVSSTNAFVYDFPGAVDTIDALATGSRLSALALDNLLNTLNLLWDATEMWPQLAAKKLLARRTALGRLADALTFRDGSKGDPWRRIRSARMGREFLFLLGTVAAHCEAVG